MIRIRKYTNRKFYDTATNRHISLRDIKQYLLDGDEVIVVDARSDKDITSRTLATILADDLAHGTVSPELIRIAIRSGTKNISDLNQENK